MNQFIDAFITQFQSHCRAVHLYGSQVIPNSLDFWSDFDFMVEVIPGLPLLPIAFEGWLHQQGQVLAREIHSSSEVITHRLILEVTGKIVRLDLGFCTQQHWQKFIPDQHAPSQTLWENTQPRRVVKLMGEPEVMVPAEQETWFLYFECLKKFMRNDHLIGLHLLLSLLKQYLELRMLERDEKRGTNVHRHGQAELLPEEIEFSQLHYQDKRQVAAYLLHLARLWDQASAKHNADYVSSLAGFTRYVQASLIHLDHSS